MQTRVTFLVSLVLLVTTTTACSLLRPRNRTAWHVTVQLDPATPNLVDAVNMTTRVIERRLDALAVRGFDIQAYAKDGRIRIDLPTLSDHERVKRVISSHGFLEIVHVISPRGPAPAQIFNSQEEARASLGGSVPADRRLLPYLEGEESASVRWLVTALPPIIDGDTVRRADVMKDSTNPANRDISFSLNKRGAEKFGKWTGDNVGEYVGIAVNHQVRTVAVIRAQMFDQAMIRGHFSKQSAEDLVLTLNSGPLPVPVKIVEEGSK